MDFSELQAVVSRAQEAAGAIVRDLAGATDAQRSALEAQLRQANDQAERALGALSEATSRAEQEHAARAAEVEENGFVDSEPTATNSTDEQTRQREEEASQKIQRSSKETLVHRETYYSGSRLTLAGMTGIHNRVREVHTDPVVLEIARHNAINAQLDKQKAIAQQLAKEAAKAERKELDSAARLYEGLPQNRGITRERYSQAEQDWKAHLDAHPERRDALAAEQRDTYIEQRNRTSTVPHREAQPDEKIAGKVVGVKSFEGVRHIVIETAREDGKAPERVVVAGDMRGVQIGKQIELQTGLDRRVLASRDVQAPGGTRDVERGR